ncbi:gasdermin-E isoform X1 [Fukomys damarensis]|uniref:Non-syndromic hearing impairment protein 5 n=1 Tax=Fukomys damarensis TaxID=885580 RepID=A0A091DMK9_FUKDA|nr:gasdermin-E isoform X1 [Fukomys damarensis]XP_010626528.1 gasdermin-E isoform X1 [Fukomys damarensis]XP_033613203.1 gasdermin-E isoform X1 [Fukomys damarensis]XP_033613205.1 gasdermin-E isoform X1 [Fukomys damarensis]XP_033613207.1 gasdermin-E isoform X1 [Fukomys damarensis]KFO31515.1 Non-syndromic hearing impairment protein 5 [Fukomys damarensis]
MFAKATRNFLKEVDAGGNLISVSNLNDSDKLQPLSLVTKKKRYWCWQRPKYQFLSVTLGDVLTEDQFLSPVVVESDFVKYEGKFENHVSGTIETVLGKVKLNMGGKGLVESQSSFGTLRKQEVDLQQLIRDSVERTINLKNPILHQVLERRNEVLCVLTQKIVTTQKCVISEHVQIEEKCGGMVGIQTKIVQVSAMEDGNVIKDTSVLLEIPAATTIAYGIIELYVKQDGQFEFCLLHEKHGGFEQERRSDPVYLDYLACREFVFMDMPDARHGTSSQDGLLSVLNQATLPLERNFSPFLELPAEQQTALHNLLQAVLFDEEFLVVLEQVCDDMAGGFWCPQAALAMGELKPPQQQDLMAFLQLAGCRIQGEWPGPEGEVSNQKLFATAYFLVSALAEMPDNAAALLGICCKLQIIPTLYHLLRVLSDDGICDLEDPTLVPLKDTERFGIVQRLFVAADINLEQEHSSVKATVLKDPHVFPLILYITLNGLCALGKEH